MAILDRALGVYSSVDKMQLCLVTKIFTRSSHLCPATRTGLLSVSTVN